MAETEKVVMLFQLGDPTVVQSVSRFETSWVHVSVPSEMDLVK